MLSYFRFRSTYYSVPQTTLVALDAVTLIKSGSDDEKYAWLKESASVAQLWNSSTLSPTTVSAAAVSAVGLNQLIHEAR